MAYIELRDVSKAFYADRAKSRARVALDRVSLEIERGEFVSLIGPSGCGKTVTLSMIAGFAQPTVGEVLFEGEAVCGPDPRRGVVFQEYSLLPWLTVEQNVSFAVKSSTRRLGNVIDSAETAERARLALSQVGLSDVAEARPSTLSGGMKQRVAIARLLAMGSEVMLMDEPFSALDELTRSALDESMRRLWKKEGRTVVFVTHSISEAVLVSSRIVLFSSSPGRVCREWSVGDDVPRDVDAPEFRALCDEIRSCMPDTACSF